jgi:hypothetical protein
MCVGGRSRNKFANAKKVYLRAVEVLPPDEVRACRNTLQLRTTPHIHNGGCREAAWAA